MEDESSNRMLSNLNVSAQDVATPQITDDAGEQDKALMENIEKHLDAHSNE